MPKLSQVSLSVFAIVGLVRVACAQQPSQPYEYWSDACDYPYSIPTGYGGDIQKLRGAEALLVNPSQIHIRSDDPNYYEFTSAAPLTNCPGEFANGDTCHNLPFLGEEMAAPSGRSGFLVAPDIVVTAAHTTNFQPSAYVVVFDVQALPDPNNGGACTPPDMSHIPAANVFLPGALITNGLNSYSSVAFVDYAAFRLQRPATGRPYLRMRRTGLPSTTDHFAMIGHPMRMPAKLQYGLTYVGQQQNLNAPVTYPLFAHPYYYLGSSGSPVYNLDRKFVEASLGTPGDKGCMFMTQSPDDLTTHYAFDLCYSDDISVPGDPYPKTWEPGFTVNLGAISAVAGAIVTPELEVSPLTDVVYVMPVGGTPTPSSTSYSLKASTGEASTSVTTSIEPLSPGQPQMLVLNPFNGTLGAGGTATATVTPTVPPGTACGIYPEVVDFSDNTHHFVDRVNHRFEIGLTEFSVTPDSSQEIWGISSPSVPSNLTYTITNLRPTPVTLSVTTSQSWLSISISAIGNGTNLTLAAAGQPNSTKTITVSLRPQAYSLSDGDYAATLTFTNLSSCAVAPQVQRTMTFHKGTVRVSQDTFIDVPIPTPLGSPASATLSIPETVCISDAELGIDTISSGVAFGEPLEQWVQHLTLWLDLNAQSQMSLQLWYPVGLPAPWVLPDYVDADLTETQTLLINNTSNGPPTGYNLSLLNGYNAHGDWTFRALDDGLAASGRNQAHIGGWYVKVKGTPGPCAH